MENGWQSITNAEEFDTPFFAVYPERIKENIALAINVVGGDVDRLRPHIKTHKTGEILKMFLRYGIKKIKCATIAEAELAAQNGITDVLLAYQPAGRKIDRLLNLRAAYPEVSFSCLVDNLDSAKAIAHRALKANHTDFNVFVDLNTGMNRTGFPFEDNLPDFYKNVQNTDGINVLGLHIYDGHLDGLDPAIRVKPAKLAIQKILQDCAEIADMGFQHPILVAGGSNTFSYYGNLQDIECSPGTFVFWDINYMNKLPELTFKPAAVLVTTIISKPTKDTLCLDLGYKSVSSENPIDKRVFFPWNKDFKVQSQSEEHLVVENIGERKYEVGDQIFCIPHHICPSIALHDELNIVEDRKITKQWKVEARRRKLCL